jgi:hypothetical protein
VRVRLTEGAARCCRCGLCWLFVCCNGANNTHPRAMAVSLWGQQPPRPLGRVFSSTGLPTTGASMSMRAAHVHAPDGPAAGRVKPHPPPSPRHLRSAIRLSAERGRAARSRFHHASLLRTRYTPGERRERSSGCSSSSAQTAKAEQGCRGRRSSREPCAPAWQWQRWPGRGRGRSSRSRSRSSTAAAAAAQLRVDTYLGGHGAHVATHVGWRANMAI